MPFSGTQFGLSTSLVQTFYGTLTICDVIWEQIYASVNGDLFYRPGAMATWANICPTDGITVCTAALTKTSGSAPLVGPVDFCTAEGVMAYSSSNTKLSTYAGVSPQPFQGGPNISLPAEQCLSDSDCGTSGSSCFVNPDASSCVFVTTASPLGRSTPTSPPVLDLTPASL